MSFIYPSTVEQHASYVVMVHMKNEGVSTAQLQHIDENVYKVSVGNLIALPMPTEITDSQGIRWIDEADQSLVGMGIEQTKAIAGKAFSEASKRTGTNIEKHSALVFDGMEVKTYTFSWKMLPLNQQEANNIRRIINELRLYSAPDLIGNAGFKFPDVFKIKFRGKHAFNGLKMLPSVITNINVSYGDGNAFFVYEGGHPVEVNLSITFSEVTSRNQDIQRRYL